MLCGFIRPLNTVAISSMVDVNDLRFDRSARKLRVTTFTRLVMEAEMNTGYHLPDSIQVSRGMVMKSACSPLFGHFGTELK